jgi:hypothetical protein
MIINKNSWHYKFWRSTFGSDIEKPDTTNLCSYCQRIFWHGLMWFSLASLILYIVMYGYLYNGLYLHTVKTLIGTLIVVAIFTVIILIVGRHDFFPKKYNDRPPSLFKQWLSAKKQRICPLIEFNSSDDQNS